MEASPLFKEIVTKPFLAGSVSHHEGGFFTHVEKWKLSTQILKGLFFPRMYNLLELLCFVLALAISLPRPALSTSLFFFSTGNPK